LNKPKELSMEKGFSVKRVNSDDTYIDLYGTKKIHAAKAVDWEIE
jgi:hypothetical protein